MKPPSAEKADQTIGQIDKLIADYKALNQHLKSHYENQICEFRDKIESLQIEKTKLQENKNNEFAFGRLRFSISLEDVDYAGQISELEASIQTINDKE